MSFVKLLRPLFFLDFFSIPLALYSGYGPVLQGSKNDWGHDRATSTNGDSFVTPTSLAISKLTDPLAVFWQERTREKSVSGYAIGAGDVMAVWDPARG